MKLVGVAPLSVQLGRGGDRDLSGSSVDGEWDTSGSVDSIPVEMRHIQNSERKMTKSLLCVENI